MYIRERWAISAPLACPAVISWDHINISFLWSFFLFVFEFIEKKKKPQAGWKISIWVETLTASGTDVPELSAALMSCRWRASLSGLLRKARCYPGRHLSPCREGFDPSSKAANIQSHSLVFFFSPAGTDVVARRWRRLDGGRVLRWRGPLLGIRLWM